MKPIYRLFYLLFIFISVIFWIVLLIIEAILLPFTAFFYYLFIGKNYFVLYDNMIFVKMNHKIEKFIDKLDPDYDR